MRASASLYYFECHNATCAQVSKMLLQPTTYLSVPLFKNECCVNAAPS